jgi:hypothetical protein
MATANENVSLAEHAEPSSTVDSSPGSFTVDSIERFELAADGTHLLVYSQGSVLSVHRSVFRKLLATLPTAIGRSDRILQDNPRFNFTMISESWELIPIDNGRNLVFKFYLPGGGDLQVCVPREQIPRMVDTLIAVAGLVVIASESSATVQ